MNSLSKKRGMKRNPYQRRHDRIRIQALSSDGVPNKEIARITGLSLSWVIEIANRKECECGRPVEMGETICLRCLHIESDMKLFSKPTSGVPSPQDGRHRRIEQKIKDIYYDR